MQATVYRGLFILARTFSFYSHKMVLVLELVVTTLALELLLLANEFIATQDLNGRP